MRALFTVEPAYGHFFPLVGLANALRQADHEVAFATSASFGPTVERAGFPWFPAGMDWLQADAEDVFPQLGGLPIDDQNIVWLSSIWGDAAPAAMAPDLVRICREFGPDVLVHEQWEMAGPLAAEAVGIPHATHGCAMFIPRQVWQALASQGLPGVRSTLGLPDDPDWGWLYRDAYLDAAPARLQYDYDLPEQVRYQPVPRGALAGESLPGWLDRPRDRPLVFVTMGTIYNREPAAFRPVLSALAAEGVEAAVVIGERGDPAVFEPVPDHIHLEPFVAQTLLLQRCAAVISHGGFNTVAESLMEGLPLVLIPQGADQPINAARCADIGLAVHLPRAEVTEQSVRDAIHRVLGEPSFRDRALEVREATAALPQVDVAVRRLEELVARAAPG